MTPCITAYVSQVVRLRADWEQHTFPVSLRKPPLGPFPPRRELCLAGVPSLQEKGQLGLQ